MTPIKDKGIAVEDREILESIEFQISKTVVKGDVEKRKNKTRNIPCPICGSGKKFKKCCW